MSNIRLGSYSSLPGRRRECSVSRFKLRTFLVAGALSAASCSHVAPTALAPQVIAAADPPVRIEYREPSNPAHARLYADVRSRHILEHLAECLSVLRVPRTITLSFTGCDGDSNAYYADETAIVTFCYEYLSDIYRGAAEYHDRHPTTPLGHMIDGPVAFVLLHESGHAVFDLLQVPILGRMEDAADYFAAVHLLRMGKEAARLLAGAAWAYRHDTRSTELDESDFADSHGLDAQRYYNIVCLAYGSDPSYYRTVLNDAALPENRAEWCGLEYRQALYAVQKLISPYMEPNEPTPVKMRHRSHWDKGPK